MLQSHLCLLHLQNGSYLWHKVIKAVKGSMTQENGAYTKLWFSCIHNSVIFYLMDAKVAVEVPAYQGRLQTKCEENCVNCFRDMSEQTFVFFLHFLFAQTNNSWTHYLIWLKFCTLVGHPKAIISIDFGANLYKIVEVTVNYLLKTKYWSVDRHKW